MTLVQEVCGAKRGQNRRVQVEGGDVVVGNERRNAGGWTVVDREAGWVTKQVSSKPQCDG